MSRQLLAPVLQAISLLGCMGCGGFEPNTTFRSTILVRSTVTNLDTGQALGTFCGEEASTPEEVPARYAKIVHVKAAPGTRLREDLIWENRSVRLEGGAPPEPDEAFWCNGGGEAEQTNTAHVWDCKSAVDDNPAARVESSAPIGPTFKEFADGYSLTLRVLHTGIVWTMFDVKCFAERYGASTEPSRQTEMTIDPN